MKTNKQTITGIVILTIILSCAFTSCSKDRIEPEDNKEKYEEAEEYLESKKAEEQEYEITEEGSGPLIGKNGTKIWLSKDILMYPSGDSVQFPYTIKLIELYSPKDMIYYQMPSTSGSKLLTTHGAIRVRAFKDDIELVLRPNKFWLVEIPNNNPKTDMLCYYGNESNNIVDWQLTFQTDFEVIADGYSGEIMKLGWISCSQEAIGSEQTTTSIAFYSDSISLANVTTFIYLPQQEGLMRVFNQNSYPLPIGETMKIVSLAKQEEQLYNFYLEETISETNQLEIVLTPTTDAKLTGILDSL